MKIAFIVSEFPSITETFILNQITGLIDRGHDVTIYARSDGNQSVVHSDVTRYRLLDRTFYYGDSCYANKHSRLLRAIGIALAKSHKKPMSLLKCLTVLRFEKKAATQNSFRQLARFLGGTIDSCDIVHCHFGPNGNLGAWLKNLGVIEGKLITTFHAYDISSFLKEGEHVYDALFETGDLFLPISERWKKKLIRLGCKGQRIAVHRMGVDTSKFSFTPRKPREDGKVKLLTVARLIEKKGGQYGVRAMVKVLQKYPHVEYRIVGDGPLKYGLSNLIDRLEISNHARLLGWKRQEEIARLMHRSDILLAPSVTSEDGDQEGIPVVLMEALSQGLPVISTQHSGIPELIQDGKSGFLVPERDVNALAERLEHLIEHPEIWPEMGRAGSDFVARYHDINKLNDQLVDMYQRLLDGELPGEVSGPVDV